MTCALMLLLLAQAPAGQPRVESGVTLDQLLALADAAHVDEQLAELQRDQVLEDQRGSYSFILPRVDLFAQATAAYSAPQTAINTFPVPGPSGLQFKAAQVDLPSFAHPDFNLGLKLTQPLFDGGRWWLSIDKGHLDVAAADAQLLEARLAVHQDMAHRFYELVRAEQSLVVLQANVQRSKEQVDRTEALFEAGRGAKSDVLAARVNLANDQIAVVQQGAQVDLARTDLNVALGRAAEAAIEPVVSDLSRRPELPAASPPLHARADRQRPELAALRRQVESARVQAGIARAGYFPTVSGEASYVRDSPSLGLVVGDPRRQYVAAGQLVLAWNLFEGRTTDVAVQKARIAVGQSQANLVKAERAVADEVERAWRTARAELEAVDLSQRVRTVAADGLALAEERFRAGAGTNLEVRDAQLKLTQAELALVSAEIDLHLAAIDLRRAVGDL